MDTSDLNAPGAATSSARHARSGIAPPTTILVTGATSQIGDFLLPMLLEQGHTVIGVSRRPPAEPWPPGLTWVQGDLTGDWSPPSAQVHVNMVPLPLLPRHLPVLARQGVRRLIAFSSTSRFTKSASTNPYDQEFVARLDEAEDAIARHGREHGIDWTILRPTLVYGRGRDRNVTTIQRFIRRYGFFPIAGQGRGLRQPVHAADLATAVCRALASDATRNRAYNLPGGETLTFRAMVERIFTGLDRTPRVVLLPAGGLRIGIRLAKLLPRYRHLTTAMADRCDQDLRFDPSEAARDLGYAPRGFSGTWDAAHEASR